MKGRDVGVEGKGLFRCLWCFLVILRVDIFESKGELRCSWNICLFIDFIFVFFCLENISFSG